MPATGRWVAQIAASALSYTLFFRLQRRGGPVVLRQIGYVITLTGIAAGVLLFGERLTPLVWTALVLMVVGLALVNRRPAAAPS